MKAHIKYICYKVVIIFCIWLIAAPDTSAEKRNPLWNVQNQFSKEGYGLKGPVYSVTRTRKIPIVELGQVVRTAEKLLDSLVFDETGHITKKYDFVGKTNVITYEYCTDSIVEYSVQGQYGKPELYATVYKRDTSGRIIEVKSYEDGKLKARRVFEYTPTGYASKYYYGNKEVAYVKKGNEFADTGGSLPESGKLDNKGRVVSKTETLPSVFKATTYYTYNQNGDLVKEGSNAKLGNKVTGTLKKKETGKRYEYVYDKHGNWTEKRTYIDGELQNDYEVREIIYKSPEEILAEKEAELEKNRLFEEELQKKGEEFASKFVEDKKRRFKESLVYRADNFLKYSVPVKGFSVAYDEYSFEFSNGTKATDVRFEKVDGWEQYNGNDNLISSDLHIALVPEYTGQGPKWYVVKYGAIADYNFNPNDSTDWVKLYRDKFYSRNNIKDEDIEKLWNDELNRQWNTSKYNRMDERLYYLSRDSVCVNELVDAYEKGFASPPVANKKAERSSLESYKRFKAEERRRAEELRIAEERRKAEEKRRAENERRKKLCTIASMACSFGNNFKPKADKVKKFYRDENGYYFKKKDNSEIVVPLFDTQFAGGFGYVYLSSDQEVAVVSQQISRDVYLFVVELDGENVKSVNYIAPKDGKKFEYPTSIKYDLNSYY